MNFKCPICGCSEFTELWSSEVVTGFLPPFENGEFIPNMNSIHLGYMCRGCTVKFEDPEKFGAVPKPWDGYVGYTCSKCNKKIGSSLPKDGICGHCGKSVYCEFPAPTREPTNEVRGSR